MRKPNILIAGPIIDYGGREVMTRLWTKLLDKDFDIKVLSTVNMSDKSVAVKSLESSQWSTLSKEIYSSSFFLRIAANFVKWKNKRSESAYYFISNKLTRFIYDFERLNEEHLISQCRWASIVLFSSTIDGKWLNVLNAQSEKEEFKFINRITGKINLDQINRALNNVIYLVHSKENYDVLHRYVNNKIIYFDQSLLNEQVLLRVPIKHEENITYGFIGRFSEEKGILPLIQCFEKSNKKLLVAGHGTQYKKVQQAIGNSQNVILKGEIDRKNLAKFYSLIDVLIIPSLHEGGPVVGLEAMAAGRLIITTAVGAMPERLENTDNTFIFKIGKKPSLEAVLDQVESISIDKRYFISNQLRAKYIEKYSQKAAKEFYIQQFKSVLSSADS